MIKKTDDVKLNNGVTIPNIGFGTWQSPDDEITIKAILTALDCGYRHIDTAAIYGNEISVGKALQETDIKRDHIFITGKVWNVDRGYETTLKAFDQSLSKLGLEYLDLYLIHWPAVSSQSEEWQHINAETWRAMETLYLQGRIRAIGVSNFMSHHLAPLLQTAEIMPMVNQIELHPGQRQAEVVEYCHEKGIAIEAWSPLGTGKMLENEKLNSIAAKYGISTAQLCIRWSLQNNYLPLPKSITPKRIQENFEVFDFEISPEDMASINELPYIGGSGLDPDTFPF